MGDNDMGSEKVTWMKLETKNLDSYKNYNRVKKALFSIPQIRDQLFDEKSNTVTVKVVCCSPEKIMQKLCSKGRGAIQRIHTIDPPKPQAQKPNEPEKPKEAEKPKEPEKPKPAPAGPSSQPFTMAPAYNSLPMMGHPVATYTMYDGPNYYGSTQPNAYYECPPPPSYNGFRYDHFSDDNTSSCSLM